MLVRLDENLTAEERTLLLEWEQVQGARFCNKCQYNHKHGFDCAGKYLLNKNEFNFIEESKATYKYLKKEFLKRYPHIMEFSDREIMFSCCKFLDKKGIRYYGLWTISDFVDGLDLLFLKEWDTANELRILFPPEWNKQQHDLEWLVVRRGWIKVRIPNGLLMDTINCEGLCFFCGGYGYFEKQTDAVLFKLSSLDGEEV